MGNEIPKIITISTEMVTEWAAQYVSEMETQRTNDWCKCEWLVHPEDVELDVHNCGNCHHPRSLHMSGTDSYCTKILNAHEDESPIPQKSFTEDCLCDAWVDPPRRRLRRGDTNLQCPIHTKEGFLLGFFLWAWKNGHIS